jgi:arsenate reductase-like glutaredoxin family protein
MNNNSASSLKELFVEQKKEYKADSIEYEMLDKKFERITQKLRTVNNAIRTSARQYISLNELTSSARKIVKLLADRYKLDQSKIIEQIYEQ